MDRPGPRVSVMQTRMRYEDRSLYRRASFFKPDLALPSPAQPCSAMMGTVSFTCSMSMECTIKEIKILILKEWIRGARRAGVGNGDGMQVEVQVECDLS